MQKSVLIHRRRSRLSRAVAAFIAEMTRVDWQDYRAAPQRDAAEPPRPLEGRAFAYDERRKRPFGRRAADQ